MSAPTLSESIDPREPSPMPPSTDDEPEMDRIRAVLEARLLGTSSTNAHIGRFTVLEKIGSGGMGVVYAAYDERLDRRVAIKLLHGATDESVSTERLVREARSMARLSHPHVATVHEIGEHRGRTFVAMEFIRGRTLRRWQAEARRSWSQVLDVYLQAGRGLAAAHAAGLVHRDFKPDNAMIDDEGTVKVLDFGLARSTTAPATEVSSREPVSFSDPATPLTRSGVLAGTPAYMGPEQLSGKPADASSDQFAFCIALFEALYDARPFSGKTIGDHIVAVMNGKLVVPSGTKTPAWLLRVLTRGLAVDPAERWPSMRALLDALHRGRTRSQRRSIYAAVGTVVVLGAAATGSDELRRWRAHVDCERAGAEIETAWDDERADAVAQAFTATGLSYAADQFARVDDHLDRFAQAWSTARADVCLQTTLYKSRSAALSDASIECLDERRDAMAALVDVLLETPAESMRKAASAAAGLPQIAECSDDVAMLRRVAPPADPAQRRAVDELRAALAEATALQSAGHYRSALERAGKLMVRAEAIDYPPLTAEVAFRLGFLQGMLGDPETSARTLETALLTAGRHGHDDVAISAYVSLAFVYGVYLTRTEDALRWGRLAEMMLGRVGREESGQGATLHKNLGTIRERQGELDVALDHYERALAINERVYGPHHERVASSLGDIAGLYREKSEYRQAIDLYERGLAIRRETLGEHHPLIGESLHNLGQLYAEVDEHERAGQHYEQARAIFAAALGPQSEEVATVILNQGTLAGYRGDLEDAEAKLREALTLREAALGPDHVDVASALSALAHVKIRRRKLEDAVADLERGLAIVRAAYGDSSLPASMHLGYLGTAYRRMGDNTRALELLERALAIQEEVLGRDHANVAVTLTWLAETRAAIGEHAEALALHRRALQIREASLGATHQYTVESRLLVATEQVETGAFEDAVPVLEAIAGDPSVTATIPTLRTAAQFQLARALWEIRDDRPRALALGRSAHATFAAEADARAAEEVNAWLATRDR